MNDLALHNIQNDQCEWLAALGQRECKKIRSVARSSCCARIQRSAKACTADVGWTTGVDGGVASVGCGAVREALLGACTAGAGAGATGAGRS